MHEERKMGYQQHVGMMPEEWMRLPSNWLKLMKEDG